MNGKTIFPINITNKISKGILVVVFSKCIKGTAHSMVSISLLQSILSIDILKRGTWGTRLHVHFIVITPLDTSDHAYAIITSNQSFKQTKEVVFPKRVYASSASGCINKIQKIMALVRVGQTRLLSQEPLK